MTEVRILFVFLQQKREDLAEMAQISGIQKAFIQLHLSVMLAGFTGLFGKLITLNEVDIVWYRMLFTSIILLVFTGLPQKKRKKLLQLGGFGVICYSLVGFFTAIIEPIIYRKKISTIEILFSLITVLGLLCIFSFDARYRYGISIGVLSSFVAALYGVCNKKVSVGVKTRTVLFYQMSAGLVVVSMIIPFYLMMFPAHQNVLVIPEGSNLWWMLCHALFCTVAMYILQIQALRTLSAFTVNLTYNLEPCYTIAIAFIVFHEARELNFSFYIGIALILISVILQTWRATLSKK